MITPGGQLCLGVRKEQQHQEKVMSEHQRLVGFLADAFCTSNFAIRKEDERVIRPYRKQMTTMGNIPFENEC